MKVEVKICGLRQQSEIDAAKEAGAQYCGFIFHAKSPRCCSPAEAALLNTHDLVRVGVFVEQDPQTILNIMLQAKLHIAQLHGPFERMPTKECARLMGQQRLWRVLWPEQHNTLPGLEAQMLTHSPYCAMFLLDAGQASGGSGRTLSWQDLAGLVSPRPWFLAGGLNPENALKALQACSPNGLDFNSGLESAPGRKCLSKIKNAVAQVLEYNCNSCN